MTARILVVYASKYGATQGIAERIAEKLIASGCEARVQPAQAAGDLASDDLAAYDAFVIGSAAYMGSWRKEARDFVRRNREFLATRPVWLFSSGPLGTATRDAQGRDVLVTSEPREFTEFREAIGPRDLRVFFGAADRSTFKGIDRLFGRFFKSVEGDFRDWAAIDAWAEVLARALVPVAAA
jgi:menaquinone-dependent protoporphyrinogen oxidase